mgnify:CR=1 FL=1
MCKLCTNDSIDLGLCPNTYCCKEESVELGASSLVSKKIHWLCRNRYSFCADLEHNGEITFTVMFH